jgi:hypothetical protein
MTKVLSHSELNNLKINFNDTLNSKGLVNFKSQKGILKHGYNEQKQVLKRYAHFRT